MAADIRSRGGAADISLAILVGIRVLTIQTGGVPETIPDSFAGEEARTMSGSALNITSGTEIG